MQKESLQKLTDSDSAAVERIWDLWKKDKITPDDLDALTSSERKVFSAFVNEQLNGGVKGDELDNAWNKIDPITGDDTRNDRWEYNHEKIAFAISRYTTEYNRMPTKAHLAEKTGLSRTTIHKHVKEFANNPLYHEQKQQFKMLADRVIAKVYEYAMNNDVKAARLFLEATGTFPAKQVVNQTNYIQVNGFILSQDQISKLKPEHIKVLEDIALEYKMPIKREEKFLAETAQTSL